MTKKTIIVLATVSDRKGIICQLFNNFCTVEGARHRVLHFYPDCCKKGK